MQIGIPNEVVISSPVPRAAGRPGKAGTLALQSREALGHLSKRNSAQLLRAAVATLSMSLARARLLDREAGAALPRLSAALPSTRQLSCRCPATVCFPPSSFPSPTKSPPLLSPLTRSCRGNGGKLGIAGAPDVVRTI